MKPDNVQAPYDHSPQKSADIRLQGKRRGHGTKSDATRERAIVALLSAKTVRAAARRAGVSEKTLRRWMADDDLFKAALAEARRTLFESGLNRLQSLTVEAIDTLATLIRSSAPPHVRLTAARTIVELGLRQRDEETIMRKLAEVEATQRLQGARRF